MIRAGLTEEIHRDSGRWIYLDIGFSSGKKSCGLAIDDGDPECVQFAGALARIVDHLSEEGPTNLLIEAPLSVAFDSAGNPAGRSIEKDGKDTRYWYVGLGCAVLTAATYLLRHVAEKSGQADIRLFEGFVTYKDRRLKSDHRLDVHLLREVVRDRERFANAIVEGRSLAKHPSDTLTSAFAVSGLDFGIPPVIMRRVAAAAATVEDGELEPSV